MIVHELHHGVAQGVHELAVRHVVGEVRRLEELLAAAGAEQVAQAPSQAFHAVGAAGDVQTEVIGKNALDREVVLLVGEVVLQGRELGGVGGVGGMPRVFRQLTDLGEALGGGVVDLGALELAAAVDDRLEHAVLGRVVVVARLHEVE